MTRKNPFEKLAALREALPPGRAETPPEPRGPARAVVRLERKGHGGKEVTRVEKLELPPAQLETWCRELKQALGCGGTVEEGAIVLQGDLRARVAPLLGARGVRKVVTG